MKKDDYFYGEHFEALGDIWDSLYGNAESFIKDYLVKSCQEGSLYWTQKINNKLVYSLLYPGAKKKNGFTRFNELLQSGDECIQAINYIEDNKHSKTHITTCPVLRGVKNSLKLKESYTWGNGIEGEFAAESLTINKLLLNFFDPFYPFDKKHKFKEGKICDIYLSAIAYKAEELEERDDVYTEGTPYNLYLERFLKENPDKTEADFEPPVIEMRAEHFRMYAPTDTTSFIEIVGLIEDIEYIEAFGKKFAKLKVNLEHREDDEYLYVNVYVGEHLLKKYKPEVGKGIHANIYMFGYFEQTMKSSNSVKDENFGCTWIMAFLLLLVLIMSALGY